MPRPFRYLADPLCITALLLYTLNRFYLKPHHIGGSFTHNSFNDVLCLPLFTPIILRLQNLLRLRPHTLFPRAWEILQHFLVFTVIFQLILPRFPHLFTTAGDPWDILAYFTGGLLAWIHWTTAARIRLGRQPPSARSIIQAAPTPA